MGADRATVILAIEFAKPSLAVLTVVSAPTLQNSLKKIGKNPAMTVVAKAELAQSYMHQPNTALFLLGMAVDFMLACFLSCLACIEFRVTSY